MQRKRSRFWRWSLPGCLALSFFPGLAAKPAKPAKDEKPPEPPPLRALLVTGGASHDYPARQEILTRGLRERIVRPIEWMVRMQGLGESDVRIPLFESSEWAKGYDIVVHDHCFPRVRDSGYLERILAPHRAGLPAVLLHGTMMSFQTGDDRWFQFTGAAIRGHEPDRAVVPRLLGAQPAAFPIAMPWEIAKEELYRVDNLITGTTPLAEAMDPAGKTHPVVWTRRWGSAQTRIFATSLGNATATVADPRYLDLVARGFLWSLGETDASAFRVVPEGESLKGLSLELPAEPAPKTGWNPVRSAWVSAHAWGSETGEAEVARTHDGDPGTSWIAPNPGPGSWSARFARPEVVGAVLVHWGGDRPRAARLEGSRDGVAWEPLAAWEITPAGGPPSVAIFPPRDLAQLRLSVDRLPPGGRFGLAEISAYPSIEAVPAALLQHLPESLLKEPAAPEPGAIEPAAWRILRLGGIPTDGNVGDLVAAGDGGAFVSIFPDEISRGKVLRLIPGGPDGPTVATYLDGIAPGTRIAWDGEWLYTLSGPRLERVRRALGTGPADERQRFPSLYSVSEKDAPTGPALLNLRIGDDGWLWAGVAGQTAGKVIDRAGAEVIWPRQGQLRFSRSGEGLTWESGGEDASPRPLPPDLGEVLARADDGDTCLVLTRGPHGMDLLSLSVAETEAPSPVDWDAMSPDAILALLRSGSPGLRPARMREAALEWGRRRIRPGGGSDPADFAAGRSEAEVRRLVLATREGRGSMDRPRLEGMLKSPDARVQAAAFLLLGDARTDPRAEDFAALGQITIPEVSAAILDALRRSRSRLAGAEAVAMALAAHPDARLAGAARDLLVTRGSVEPAYRALEADRESHWVAALEVILAIRPEDVVEVIAGHLDQNRRAELRRLLQSALVDLHDAEGRSPEILARIERELRDPRTDRIALLAAMEDRGLRGISPDLLVDLAPSTPGLESYIVRALTRQGKSPSPGALEWLAALKSDKSHDPRLRGEAMALLALHTPTESYRSVFARMLAMPDDVVPREGSETLLRSWAARSDHAREKAWLVTRIQDTDPRARELAWTALLVLLSSDDTTPGDRGELSRLAFNEIRSGDPDKRTSLLAALASLRDEDLAKLIKMRGLATDDNPFTTALREIAGQRGIDPATGDPMPPIANRGANELDGIVSRVQGDPQSGKRLFNSLGCAVCHNPHGEGPSPGPDLAGSLNRLGRPGLLVEIVRPDEKQTAGFAPLEAASDSGFTLAGWRMEDGAGDRDLPWYDSAGNVLDSVSETHRDGLRKPLSPCGGAASWSPVPLAHLLEYLKSLSN